MIIYKYLSSELGKAVIGNGKVAFSLARYFNDPFETEAGYPVPKIDPVSDLMNGIRSWGAREAWTRNCGVLCLTRSPLNPLMWAHYGEEHRGFVLGFDAERSGFLSEESCLIPAQFGSIIYTQTRPIDPLPHRDRADPINVGREHRFRSDHYDKLSQLFLQKPACWSYEEEVRVVKCIADFDEHGVNPSGVFDVRTSKNEDGAERRTYLYQLQKGSLRKVIVGQRNRLLNNGQKLQEFVNSLRLVHPEVEVSICQMARETWNIELKDADDFVRHRVRPEMLSNAGAPAATDLPEE